VIKPLYQTAGIKVTVGVVEAAATSGQEQILRFLDQRLGIGCDKERWFRIARRFNAAKRGDAGAVRQLLENGTPPDLQGFHGVTPLAFASSGGHKAVVQVLLATDSVDVNVRSADGQTPLFWAAAKGHSKVVKLLLDHGAEQDCRDKKGRSPVSIAQSWCHADVIRMFTEHDTFQEHKRARQSGDK